MSYDGLGNRTHLRDPRGNLSQWVYDGLGRQTRFIDAEDKFSTASYDGEGLKTRETDRRGVQKDFTYDSLGRPRLTSIVPSISGEGWSHEVRYEDVARKRFEKDAMGRETVYDLDRLGRVVKVTDPAPFGFTVVTTYDGVGNKLSEKDRNGNVTRFDYDALNRPFRTRDPAPFSDQTVEVTYLDAANQVVEKDRRGTLKTTQKDPLGRVLTVTRAGVLLEYNEYDGNGNKTLARDGSGKETVFTYDGANRLVLRIDGNGTTERAETKFTYDATGNLETELDQRAKDLGLAFSVKNAYDALNRLETTTDGEGNLTRYDYDPEGNRTLVKEPEGAETTFAYDELGKLSSVAQPGNLVTTYKYDRNRNRIRQQDAEGHVVVLGYDELNRLRSMTQDPDGLRLLTLHDYDRNGNETLTTDAKGQTVTSGYDELNRLKSRTYAFAAGDSVRPWRHTTSIAYGYDPNGNPTSIDESVASGTDPPATLNTTRGYDLLDRMTSETTTLPDGGTRPVSYTYFENGTRKTVIDPGNVTTSYTYDGQNRLKTATTGAGTAQATTTSYTYFPDDLLKTVAYPNGVGKTYGYDKADRLRSIVNASGATAISSYAYGYDKNGNRLSQVEVNGGLTETTTYTYDALNRLETIAYPADSSFPNGRVVAYGYDRVGNRTSETTTDPTTSAVLSSKTGVFDNVNRLVSLTDSVDPSKSASFTWDENGNQTGKTQGGVTTEFQYDTRNQLVETAQGAAITSRFQYDFEGRRTKKIGLDGIRQYVYDDTSTFVEYDADGNALAKYDYGSDRLISLTHAVEGRRFYTFDGLGSVVNLTDDAGSAIASYHWDTWGQPRFETELDASKNPFGFTGYFLDRETDLYYAKARFYDPEVGRFISQDSVLGDINDPPSLHRFFYANDNPTRYIDPTGHQAIDEETRRAIRIAEEANEPVARDVLGNPLPSSADELRGLARHNEEMQRRSQLSELERQGPQGMQEAARRGLISIDDATWRAIGMQAQAAPGIIWDAIKTSILGGVGGGGGALVGRGAAVALNLGPKASGVLTGAASGAGADITIQTGEIALGERERFNPLRTVLFTGVGGLFGRLRAPKGASAQVAEEGSAAASAQIPAKPAVPPPPRNVEPPLQGSAPRGVANAERPLDLRLPPPEMRQVGGQGEFSIIDWTGYPQGVPRPQAPFRVLEGAEYQAARQAANRANRALHKADPSLAGKQIHEVKPVKFGGSPTALENKVPLPRSEHRDLTNWWNAFLRLLTGN
jgi:RHS repeat-associated protein